MGILRSFNIGISGLSGMGEGMAVISDNISNAGTTGFKSSRAEFQDVLAKTLKGIDGGDQLGAGTKLAHVKPMMTQGDITRTESITDMAINGNGLFVLDTSYGQAFSRDGSFNFDKNGNLVNSDGYLVQGFQINSSGDISNMLGPLKLGYTTIPAKSTDNVKIFMNLDSRESTKEFDIKDPEKTSSYSNSLTVYDNVGTARLVTVFYNKKENNIWEYHAVVDGADSEGGKSGEFVEMAKGELLFNDKGVLDDVKEKKNEFNFNKGAAQGQQIAFDFGKTLKQGGNGLDASTQYGSGSAVSRHGQNGASAATLTSLSFNDKGILSASYNNGETKELGQVAIAKFENNEGLFKLGKNLLKASKKSGQPAIGRPGEAGRGDVLAKSIELSNVDIANEFVNLMNFQRNFTASAKSITTADQMLQEVLNIKR